MQGQLLWRGPHVRMGVCEGQPTLVAPSLSSGRAEYFGPMMNRLAAAPCTRGALGGHQPQLQPVVCALRRCQRSRPVGMPTCTCGGRGREGEDVQRERGGGGERGGGRQRKEGGFEGHPAL